MPFSEYRIPFTQYLRPDGRQVEAGALTRNAEVYRMAERIIGAGGWFTAEIVGEPSLVFLECFIDDPDPGYEDEPRCLSNQLVPNGPEVLMAVDTLVLDSYKALFGDE